MYRIDIEGYSVGILIIHELGGRGAFVARRRIAPVGLYVWRKGTGSGEE